ncbi:delta-lactam-biosynthetic de-N-acetylase [Fictibacillus sp. Mic-4]|uniref:delta-lactam-biosynthetic de-N-acetylase n=1 Tax=Fictibacillus TaxID=1329200 RepID=UPI0003F5272E|nr:delta-lactam-biosynthetic de-N-acetylase [Fictibacillus gelatini]
MKKWVILLFVFILAFPLSINTASANGVSNKRFEWYFERKGNEVPPTTDKKYLSLIKKYDSLFIGDTSKKDIYLTFDNGYENGYTDDVLNTLKAKKVPATFFVTGHYLKTNPDLIKRMVKEGHIVGNHSYHHPDMTTVSNERLKEELEKVKEDYTKITGKTDMHYLRPPRGVFSERTVAEAKKLGYTHVFWSLAFLDWERDRQRGWEYAYKNVMKQIHPGCILLLHSVSRDNSEALGKIIDDLRKKGYTFKSLDDLRAGQTIPPVLINP